MVSSDLLLLQHIFHKYTATKVKKVTPPIAAPTIAVLYSEELNDDVLCELKGALVVLGLALVVAVVVFVAVEVFVEVELVTVGGGLMIVREAQMMEGLPQVRVPVNPEGVTLAPSVVQMAEPISTLAVEYMFTV